MFAVGPTTPVPHRIGILMSPAGRFLECINCQLRIEFPAEARYDTIVKLFEVHPCRRATPATASLLRNSGLT
jgi:hypothetical protein